MKKLTAVCLSILLLLAIPLQTIAFASGTGVFAAGTANAFRGETVDVPVVIENNPGMVGMIVYVGYDADVLTLQSVQGNDLFGAGETVFGNDLSDNPYTLLWEDSLSHTDYTQSGLFATLTFLVDANAPLGATPITITYDQGSTFTTNMDDAVFETRNGSVNVCTQQDAALAVKTAPTKTTYWVGDALDTTGLVLTYSDEYGASTDVTEGFTCTPTTLEAAGTQTITVSYNGTTATFDVTVNALLTPELSVKTAPTKTTYWEGDTLDPDGLVLTYTDEYGVSTTVTGGYTCAPTALTADVTEITVTYNGAVTTFSVTVNALLTPTLVVKTLPTKTTYWAGEMLDPDGMVLTYTNRYGVSTDVTTGYTCTPRVLNANITEITVSYSGATATFNVTVNALLTPTLAVTNAPAQTTYWVGDTFDTTGLELTYTDEYGVETTVTEGYYCTPTTFDTAGTETITFRYNGAETTFDVTVNALLKPELSVKTAPTKTVYVMGETLETAGLVLTYTNDHGVATDVYDGYTCTPTAFTSAGRKTITVTYNGSTATFNVTVTASETPVFALGSGSAYVGDTVDIPFEIRNNCGIVAFRVFVSYDADVLTLLSVQDRNLFSTGNATFDNDMTENPYIMLWEDSLSRESNTQNGVFGVLTFLVKDGANAGDTTIHIAYEADSTYDVNLDNVTFDTVDGVVTVKALQTPTLVVKTAPTKTTYWAGDDLDTTGLVLTYTDEYGVETDITEGYTCAPTELTADTDAITVTYNGATATFDVTVNALLTPTLAVKTAPTKTTYWAGDALDTTGLVLTYTDEYGVSADVTEGFTCAPTELTADTDTIIVTYNGVTATFDVTVNALLTPTLVVKTAPTKTTYWAGDALDTTGLVLTYTDEYGEETDATEGFTCAPTELTAETDTITVTYNGVTATFDVTVNALLTPTLVVKTAPTKTDYFTGDALDTTGLVLTYTDAYGAASDVTEGFTCTPTTLDAAGTQTVTVSYNDLTATFTVEVEELVVLEPQFALGADSGAPGDTVEIPLTVADNPGIIGMRVFISYDAQALTLDSVVNGNLFAGGTYTFGNDLAAVPYKVVWEDSLSAVNHTDNGLFATLVFRVNEGAQPGDTAVTLTIDTGSVYDTDLHLVTFSSQNGSVTIEEAPEEGGWSFAEYTTLHLVESEENGVMFVMGIDRDDPVVSDYVITTGGWRSEVELNDAMTESTGAVLKIYNADGDLVESYPIVMFGDMDGNGLVEGPDAILMRDAIQRLAGVDWMIYDSTDEHPQTYAADINHDGTMDGQDATMLADCIFFNKYCNQNWMTESDPWYE